MAVAAACFRAKLAGQPSPAGERTARVLAGYRRTASDRGSRTSAAGRGLGPGGRARHLPPAAVRRSKTNQEGEVNDVRFVKGRRGARSPDTARRYESGAGRPRGAVVAANDRPAVHGRGAGRRRRVPSDRALGAGRAGVGADEPGSVDHGRDAGRELEDLTDGGALLRRGNRGTRCCCSLSVGRQRGRSPQFGSPVELALALALSNSAFSTLCLASSALCLASLAWSSATCFLASASAVLASMSASRDFLSKSR